jgi:penicillin-binding protein 1A
MALAVAAMICAVAVAAWFASPAATGLQTHVAVRLRGTGARAITVSSIAPSLRDAVVATEDERFYLHDGVDIIGVLRALPYDVAHLSLAQGGSTITEQVAKLLYLRGNDHDPWRKLEDAMLALKLESRYSKEQILAAYLNSVYFGEGAYGAWAGSRRYFGVVPARLDTARASLLAGLIQAPSAYDPRRNPTLARARQVEVLRSLVRDGFLTEEEATTALTQPLRLRGGGVLPPLYGVSLGSGPVFTWWKLGLGTALVLGAAGAFVATRMGKLRLAHGLIAVKAASLVLLIVGMALAVRAFRAA